MAAEFSMSEPIHHAGAHRQRSQRPHAEARGPKRQADGQPSAGRQPRRLRAQFIGRAALLAASFGLAASPASADKLKHPIAVFSGLDKITGRIITFEIATNETVQFGSLQITERVCYSRPATEAPQTDTFVEIDNIDANNQLQRVFTGWMFAGSPSLHALDHPVYDIWLLRCKGPGELIASPPETAAVPPPDAAPAAAKPAPAKPKHPPVTPQPAAAPADAVPVDNGAPIEVGPPPGMTAPAPAAPPPNFPPPPAQDDAN